MNCKAPSRAFSHTDTRSHTQHTHTLTHTFHTVCFHAVRDTEGILRGLCNKEHPKQFPIWLWGRTLALTCRTTIAREHTHTRTHTLLGGFYEWTDGVNTSGGTSSCTVNLNRPELCLFLSLFLSPSVFSGVSSHHAATSCLLPPGPLQSYLLRWAGGGRGGRGGVAGCGISCEQGSMHVCESLSVWMSSSSVRW